MRTILYLNFRGSGARAGIRTQDHLIMVISVGIEPTSRLDNYAIRFYQLNYEIKVKCSTN